MLIGEDEGESTQGRHAAGVSYRPPNQDDQVDEVFYKRLAEVLQLLTSVLMGDFNLPDICWKYNTTERKETGRFLECK